MRLTAKVEIDEQHVAGRPHPHALDRDHARRSRAAMARIFSRGAGRRGVGQRLDRAAGEPPAGDEMNTATTTAAAESAHG